MRDTRNAHEDELQSLSFDDRWDRWETRDVLLGRTLTLCKLAPSGQCAMV